MGYWLSCEAEKVWALQSLGLGPAALGHILCVTLGRSLSLCVP